MAFAIMCLCLTGPLGRSGVADVQRSYSDPHSLQAFQAWLGAANNSSVSDRSAEYSAFKVFLKNQNVSGVVPAWQLLRTDADYAARCGLDAFVMPPRAKWHAIVPTLRLVRDEVIPLVGTVTVNSAWRSDELNDCVNGAKQSKHLAFSAVDLIARDRLDKRKMFADLCRMHSKVGPRNQMGFGAYLDDRKPRSNRQGRFHIDAAGYRNWGFDYTAKSSPCRYL